MVLSGHNLVLMGGDDCFQHYPFWASPHNWGLILCSGYVQKTMVFTVRLRFGDGFVVVAVSGARQPWSTQGNSLLN